ncbi:MAG: hypothetical protein ACLSUW_04435 [Akkermansia sp.]
MGIPPFLTKVACSRGLRPICRCGLAAQVAALKVMIMMIVADQRLEGCSPNWSAKGWEELNSMFYTPERHWLLC